MPADLSPARDTELRAVIADERRRTEQRLAALTREVDEIIEASDLTAADDEHDPDGQTIAYERAKATALRREAEATLVELDEALARLDAGTYGTCTACGEPIAVERLLARPTARTCVHCVDRA